MSIREIQQCAALIIAVFTILIPILSCRTRPDKRKGHYFFITYGLIGVVFYVIVLSNGHGHELSPTRSLVKDTLIFTWPLLYFVRDIWRIRNGHGE